MMIYGEYTDAGVLKRSVLVPAFTAKFGKSKP